MKPIGPLMREHRLIERMVNILAEQAKPVAESQKIDTRLMTVTVDFFQTYADRTHHGKEEEILFSELARKQLSPEHNKIMQELIQEHILGVTNLSELAQRYKIVIRLLGKRNVVLNIESSLRSFTDSF